MKLRNLLAASVATFAIAGTASANDLVLTAAPGGAAATVYASEQTASVDGLDYDFHLRPTGGATYLDTNQIITVTLTGATFDGGTGFAISGQGTCAGNFSITTGGGAGDSTVSIVADTLSGCTADAANSILIETELDIANGTAVSVSATVVTEAGSTPVGGSDAGQPLALASWAPAFSVAATDGANPVAQLPGFTAFAADDIIGTYTIANSANTTVSAADGTTGIDLTAVADTSSVTITGDHTGLANMNGSAPVAGVVTLALGDLTNAATANTNIQANEDGANAIIGGDYTVVVTLDLPAGYTDQTASATMSIDRAGTDFTFPYTLDGTTAAAIAGTTIRYRISNNGGTATGPVTLQMRSWDSAPTNTGLVTLAASIAAGADLVFTPAEVEALVGAYGVGDFVVNVEASAANNALTANYAMINSSGTTNYAVLQ